MFFFFVGLLCGVIIAQEFPTIPKLRPQINKIIQIDGKRGPKLAVSEPEPSPGIESDRETLKSAEGRENPLGESRG